MIIILVPISTEIAFAAKDYEVTFHKYTNTIHVKGVFTATLPKTVKKILKENDVKRIILDSPGGRIRYALQIGKLIAKYKLGTYSGMGCYSACTMAFISGHTRSLAKGAQLGFHQIDIEGPYGGVGSPLYYRFRAAEHALKKRFRKAGVSDEFMKLMFSEKSHELWTPSHQHLKLSGVIHKTVSQDAIRKLIH